MKRILVGSNLAAGAANALGRAIRLAAKSGATLSIVHATDVSDEEHRSALHQRILTEARIMAEELTDIPLEISVRISGDSPARAIIEEADRLNADLIVLGGHGTPRFRDALFGTTGTHVVRNACRRVLVVQNDHARPYAKVLLAMPGNTAPEILNAAIDTAPEAALHAVHALSPSFSEMLAGARAVGEVELERERDLEAAMVTAQEKLGAKVGPPHANVKSGEPLSIMMEEAAKLEPDLLVMGTRRRVAYLGSHAVDTLFWCPNDVLVVPEPAGANA